MTDPTEDLDQWLDGVRGRRPPTAETGFDPLDARLVEALRRQQQRDEAAVPDEILARGRKRLERHLSADRPRDEGTTQRPSLFERLLSPWPFAAGAAVGLAAALIGLAVLPGLLREPAGPWQPHPPVAASRLAVTVLSEDPAADESGFVTLLLAGGIPFSVVPSDPRAFSQPLPFDQREVVLVYPETSNPALEAWFRERGVSPPPAGGEVRVLIRRRSAADRP